MARLRAADTRVRDIVFVNFARTSGESRQHAQHLGRTRRCGVVSRRARGDPARVRCRTAWSFSSATRCQHSTKMRTASPPSSPTRRVSRFDVVIAADGAHSGVRALVFGPETDYVKHLGVYIATLPLDGEAGTDLVMYNTPGRAVAIHPAGGHPGVAFMFRAPQIRQFDHRDLGQHKRLLCDAYAGAGWRVPELLDRVRAADDLYFDSVSRVRVPTWSNGRVDAGRRRRVVCVAVRRRLQPGDDRRLHPGRRLDRRHPLGVAGLRGSASAAAGGQGERGGTLATNLFVPATAGGHRCPQRRRPCHSIGPQDPRNGIPAGKARGGFIRSVQHLMIWEVAVTCGVRVSRAVKREFFDLVCRGCGHNGGIGEGRRSRRTGWSGGATLAG